MIIYKIKMASIILMLVGEYWAVSKPDGSKKMYHALHDNMEMYFICLFSVQVNISSI